MDLEEKFLAKVSGNHSLSSSVQSTPEKIIHSDDASRSSDLLQEFIKSGIKKDLLRNLDKKASALSKSKTKELLKSSNKTMKKQELRKTTNSPTNLPLSKKQSRKGENPVRLTPASLQASNLGSSGSWICKNLACKAVLSMQDSFCRRCSCCICRSYDENKDPSLWFVCSLESGDEDCCGSSCHISCALRVKKAGVVDLGQLMQLDCSYCCASCGKVSGILGTWKKQLIIAKDARRLDVLCNRIYLSYRLLQGTSRFKELYEIVKDAKNKLEDELGSIDNASSSMMRGLVSRLSISNEVQKLCAAAIEKVEELSSSLANGNSLHGGDQLHPACNIFFEEITSSKISTVLLEPLSQSSDSILGYKLWYFKSGEEAVREEPDCVLEKSERRVSISDLQPCTEYTIRIISFDKKGTRGHSEIKCFTKSVEVIQKNDSAAKEGRFDKALVEGRSTWANNTSKPASEPASALFKVRELGKILHTPGAQQTGISESFCSADIKKCCSMSKMVEPKDVIEDHVPLPAGQLDLNVVASVPDLNEEFTPPIEFSRDEENGYAMVRAVEAYDDAAPHEVEKNSKNSAGGAPLKVVQALDSPAHFCRKRAMCPNEETHDCDSTLVNGSHLDASNGVGCLDENFEYCVKIVRWLECGSHINKDFRMKFLTWYSLRSKEQERRIVNTFIQTMQDDPSSLGGQLVDSFSDIISTKRPRMGPLQ